MKKNIVIFGATAAIAQPLTRLYAAEGHHLYLIARNKDKLAALMKDLTIRYPEASFSSLSADLADSQQHHSLIEKIVSTINPIDIALIAYGTLTKQQDSELSYDLTAQTFTDNCLSPISLLMHLSQAMKKNHSGTIAVITSVAGDRGRQSNFIYGSAKGALSLFLQGLRNRLYRSGVHIVTIKPGLINTPMTADFNKDLLWSEPDAIAKRIKKGIEKKRDVIYAPSYWFLIMLIIKLIPERIFKRLML